jgi:hypothetical protein
MKQSAQKSENFSLVRPARVHDSAADGKATVSNESFASWRNSVAPTLVQSTPREAQAKLAYRLRRRSLTSTEVTRVNLATIREGTVHCHWPPEVVLSFLAAEVIKRKQS